MNAVFDTNILIDYLLGNLSARGEIGLYNNLQISIITKMEILVGTSEKNQEIVEDFLKNFVVINLNEEIAEIAVILRKENKIKLPDAIIWATAKFTNSLLITRNTKDFPAHALGIKIPYSI